MSEIKHIDVYFSDLDYIEDLQKSDKFVPTYQYAPRELEKMNPFEWGKLNLTYLQVHLITDTGNSANCPWCGDTNPIVRKKSVGEYTGGPCSPVIVAFAECSRCHACSPKMVFSEHLEQLTAMGEDSPINRMVINRWISKMPMHKKVTYTGSLKGGNQ